MNEDETVNGHQVTERGEPSPSERLERRNRELAILNSISEALNSSADVPTALERTITLVAELLGLRSAWVWLLNSLGEPYLAASRELPPFLRQPEQMGGWLCHCLETFLAGETGAANVNVVRCSRLQRARSGSDGLRYHASIPLYLGQKRVGVMNVASPDWKRLGPEELELLRTIGNEVAVTVERARLAEESARVARLEERNRLAREIHDTLTQELAAISLHLETADALLPDSPETAHERVRSALELSREGLREARRSVQDLRAAPLDNHTLVEALHELGSRFTHDTGIETHVHPRALAPNLPPDVEAAVYRITQEALSNVQKHSGARTVEILLDERDEVFVLVISDDGRGFERSAVEHGFGLLGMRERIAMLGGELEIRSAQGKGTTVEVRVPIALRSGDVA